MGLVALPMKHSGRFEQWDYVMVMLGHVEPGRRRVGVDASKVPRDKRVQSHPG